MNIKAVLLSLGALVFTVGAFAQGVEHDDMYFNSKDRAKLKAHKQAEEVAYQASAKKTKKMVDVSDDRPMNPTDSYSARNVNPEYAARANAETAQYDNQDYFVNKYQYSTGSNLNNWNNNFNSWYNNPWYGSNNYYGSSNWNSPYYGYNSPYYSPWNDPTWGYNGWSTSFSYYWGNSYNYGWGGRPYCGVGWGAGWGYGSGWYGSPTVVVINNGGYEGGRTVSYGKRGMRGSSTVAPTYSRGENTGSRTRSTSITPQQQPETGGRVSSSASSSRRSDEYYNRSWRSTSSGSQSGTSSGNDSWRSTSRSSSYDDGGSRSNSGSSYTPSSSPSRSSFEGGGGRSSGSSSSGSSGGGGSSSGGSRGRTR